MVTLIIHAEITHGWLTEKMGLVTVTRGVTARLPSSAPFSSSPSPLIPAAQAMAFCKAPHTLHGEQAHLHSLRSLLRTGTKLPVSISTYVFALPIKQNFVAITPTKRPVPAPGSASLSLKSWPPEQTIVVGRSPRTFPAVHWHFSVYFTHTRMQAQVHSPLWQSSNSSSV